MRKAQLFSNGGSLAVRLLATFRFDCDYVYARRDQATGDVILSKREITNGEQFEELRLSLGIRDGESSLEPLDNDRKSPFGERSKRQVRLKVPAAYAPATTNRRYSGWAGPLGLGASALGLGGLAGAALWARGKRWLA
jgi:hypothetical protein